MKKHTTLLAALFILCAFAGFAQLPGYAWSKTITIQSAQVTGGSSHSNFPVLISHTDPDLRTVANGGACTNANGYDIRFTASDGLTLLDHQLESYDPLTGKVVAWVRVPTLNFGSNTTLYIYYGGYNTISTDPSVNTVWDANFAAAWHLNQNENDGTANANNLTINGGTGNDANGIAAAAQNFATAQFLRQGASASLQISGDLTLEAWVKLTTLQASNDDNFILATGGFTETTADNYQYILSMDPSGNLRIWWEHGNGLDEVVVSNAATTFGTGVWKHIAVSRDAAAKTVSFFVNGVQLGTAVSYANNADGGTSAFTQLGQDQGISINDMDGSLDEVRISNSARSAGWIQTTYNSVSNPSTFYTLGSATTTCPVPPSTAVASADQQICANTTTLSATAPTVGVGSWVLLGGVGNISNPNATNITLTNLGIGPNIFRWKVANGTCPESFDDVVVAVDTIPTAAAAGSDMNICTTSTTLNGNVPAIGAGLWTVISGSGNFASAVVGNTPVSGLTTGANVFVWTTDLGVCPSSSDTVVITVDANPSAAVAGNNQTTCNDTLFLSATTPAVGTGMWSVLSGSGVVTTPAAAGSTVTGAVAGQNSFVWTVSNGTCPSTKDTVVITVDQFPTTANAGANQTICGATALLSGNTPAVGTTNWSFVSGSGTVNSPNNTSTTVSGITIGQSFFVYTISNGTCPSSTDTIMITRDPAPSTANAGTDQITCITGINLSATVPTVGIGTWALISGSGSVTSPNSATSAVTGLASGQNIFVWSVVNSVCPASTDTVIITMPTSQIQPNAGSNQTVCSTTTNMAAVNPTTGTGTWSLLSGTGNIVSPNSNTTLITNLSNGANSFIWNTSYQSSCAGMSDTVVITVLTPPTIANAGIDFSVCGSAATLSGSNPSVGTGTWTQITGSGTIASPNNSNSGVSGLSTGANVFVWSIVNGACPASTDTVIITSSLPPSTAVAGIDFHVCTTTATLAATAPVTGTGAWVVPVGTAVVTNPTSPTSGVTSLSTGNNVFLWTVSNGVCPDSKDTVLIIVDTPPTTANAGADIESQENFVTLNGNSPVIGTGLWYNISSSGNLITPSNSTCNFQVSDAGDYYLVWSITNGVCPASEDTVRVRIGLIDIPQVITPNGDGDNDYFEIPALKNSGQVSLKVYNRWGREVYAEDKYNHNFNGVSNDGKELVEDNYLYIIHLNGEERYKGYFAIKRK